MLDDFDIVGLPWLIVALMLINGVIALITPETEPTTAKRHASKLRHAVMRGDVLAFFLVYLLLQVAHGPYYVFYSVYLQQHHYSSTATGLLWSLGVCSEIVLFLGAQPLLRRLGARRLLLISLALGVLRWWVIAYCADWPVAIALAQLLHAATFGAAHVVAVHLLRQYFGDLHQGKGQALYSSISFGLGGMLGSYFSGYFWDLAGAELVYTGAALVCGLAWLMAFLGVARQNRSTLG